MKTIKQNLFLLFAVILSVVVFPQEEINHWIFGEDSHMKFDNDTPVFYP